MLVFNYTLTLSDWELESWVKIAALSGALAVMLGAFGAHGLKKMITPEMLVVFQTGVQYQFYHTFALFIVGILINWYPLKSLKYSAYLFMVGIILFSGSLYLLAITGIRYIGVITPIGGVAFIAGWITLAFSFRQKTTH